MITGKDVTGLRAGDVVEITDERWPEGSVMRGPAYYDDGELRVGHLALATRDGRLYLDRPRTTLTVISRAKPPLYVNSDRTKPEPGDVVRDADGTEASRQIWVCGEHPPGDRYSYPEAQTWLRWNSGNGRWTYFPQSDLPTRLRLLVDGRTGQVVP